MSRTLLLAAAMGVVAFGCGLVLAPTAGERLFYAVYFGAAAPPVPFPPEAVGYIRFANGVLGAVMIGWMALVVRMVLAPPLRDDRFVWRGIALSLTVWYAVDTAFSIASGVVGNVVLNTVLVAAFGVPLAARSRRCNASRAR